MIADGFDLAENVRRQEHGLPVVACLTNARVEDLLHEWIETARRFVEEEQLGAAASVAISATFCLLPWLSVRIFLSWASSNRSTSSSRYLRSTGPWMLPRNSSVSAAVNDGHKSDSLGT